MTIQQIRTEIEPLGFELDRMVSFLPNGGERRRHRKCEAHRIFLRNCLNKSLAQGIYHYESI